ncbi:MAG: hypothetical protein ABI790_08645 [Betaproteobacteria bacterium]
MIPLYLAPPVIGFLLLAAHYYRAENYPGIILSLLMTGLIFVRRPWAARVLQMGLLLGAVEWLRSILFLVMARNEAGAPYLRLAIILGGVCLFTALAALVFQTSRIRTYFGFGAIAKSGTGNADAPTTHS